MIIIGMLVIIAALFVLLTFSSLWVSRYSSRELKDMGLVLGYENEQVKSTQPLAITRRRTHKPALDVHTLRSA